MKFSNSILLSLVLKAATAIAAAVPTAAESQCDAALKEVFAGLAATYHETGNTVAGPIPEECAGIVGTTGKVLRQPRNDYDRWCEAVYGSYNRYVATYSYINTLNETALQENSIPAAATIIDDILTNGCTSGTVFISDGTELGGYDIWYEVYSNGTECHAGVDMGDMEGSILGTLAALGTWQKTSACSVIVPPAAESGNTRIVIRLLHNEEARFASVADVQCPLENPGYDIEVEKC